MLRTYLTVLIVSIVLPACAVPQRPAPIASYDLRIRPSSNSSQTIDGLTLTIRPATFQNAKSFPALIGRYRYWNPAIPRNVKVAEEILTSVPSFELAITNSTSHTISFSRSAIRAIDDAGNVYTAQLKSDINAEVESTISSVRNRGWAVDPTELNASARSLKIVDRNYESLPGLTEKRFLVFDMNIPPERRNANTYAQFFSRMQYLKVMLYDLPVLTDDAGNTKKTAKFEFVFDVKKL
jgi:hypothetical protein